MQVAAATVSRGRGPPTGRIVTCHSLDRVSRLLLLGPQADIPSQWPYVTRRRNRSVYDSGSVRQTARDLDRTPF